MLLNQQRYVQLVFAADLWHRWILKPGTSGGLNEFNYKTTLVASLRSLAMVFV